jgi:hypothetical protein
VQLGRTEVAARHFARSRRVESHFGSFVDYSRQCLPSYSSDRVWQIVQNGKLQ